MRLIGFSKKNITGIIIAIVSFGITFLAVQYYMAKSNASKVERQLKQASDDLNGRLPLQMDTYSRLDSTTSVENHTFRYFYTLIDMEKAIVNLDTVNKYVRPEILRNARTNPNLKGFRDHNIILDYVYYDKNGIYVTTITAKPEDYNNF